MDAIRLLRIPDDLSEAQHQQAMLRITDEKLDGVEITYLGSLYGPTWDPKRDYDLDFLRHYRGIRTLSLFLPSLSSLRGLSWVQEELEALSIGESPELSLAPLAGCRRMRSLSLVRNEKDVAVVGGLANLRELNLTGYRLDDCDFLRPLDQIESLYVGFGGAETVDVLVPMQRLRRLQLHRIKGLERFEPLSRLASIETLIMEDLARLQVFPAVDALPRLSAIRLSGVNGLEDLSALRGRHLEEFVLLNSKLPASVVRTAEGMRADRLLILLATQKEQAALTRSFQPNTTKSINDFQRFDEPQWVPVRW